jgi:hypothetical protein
MSREGMMADEVNVGDAVACRIPGLAGTPGSIADYFVLGFMDYGDGYPKDIALVGDERAHGMPVNVAYLTVISHGHDVSTWANRYTSLYPTAKLQRN